RLHTTCYRDWSSDVCSSDLPPVSGGAGNGSATEPQRDGETKPEDNDGPSAGSPDVTSASSSAKDFFELTTDPIDVGPIARRVVRSEERRVGQAESRVAGRVR